MRKVFPTLYKVTATGAVQTWTIEVNGNEYRTLFGQRDGQIQESEPTKCFAKNIGRANETSADQQAMLEARSQWEKKLKKDYTQNPNVVAGEKSELIQGGILPMLAHKFSEHGDKLMYPCFVQPKLDGHRCIGMPGGALWSRSRKRITGVPRIEVAVADLDLIKGGDLPLDGELYNHDYKTNFEEISSCVRQEVPKEGHEAMQYHVYDVAVDGLTFRQRLDYLRRVIGGLRAGPIKIVETREVANEDELMLAFEDFLAQGYEGAIARNADGLYVRRRSYDLLKIKKFDDAEFECIGVIEGKGKMAGHAIFSCLADNGVAFGAKMKGSHKELARYFEHPELVVGKQLTVKYQGLTNKNKVPRFPVALRVRE